MPEAFICDAVRTPIGRYAGGLAKVRTDDLAAIPLKALAAHNPGLDLSALDESTLVDATAELPGADVPVGTAVVDALVATGLVDSKKAARRAIADGAVSVNGAKLGDDAATLGPGDYLHGRVAILRRGRKNLAAARLV